MFSFVLNGKTHTHYKTASNPEPEQMQNLDDVEYWIGEVLAETSDTDSQFIPISKGDHEVAWFAMRVAGKDFHGNPNYWEQNTFQNKKNALAFLAL